METITEHFEVVEEPTASAAPPPPPRATFFERLRERIERLLQDKRVRRGGIVLAGLAAIGVIAMVVAYYRFAGVIDRRLAGGAFSSTVGIYAAPRQVAAGDAMTREELLERLRRAGYSASPDNPYGFFVANGSAVDIRPGADSLGHSDPARLEFAHNKIARIVSLRSQTALPDYRIDPQLIANLSQNRERRTLVRFNDIPKSLVNAVVDTEDKRFFKHVGFDPLRVMKAAYIDLRDGRKQQGASTLSMQLARNLWLDRDKAWKRKLSEVIITMHLEFKLTKEQIFENYANQVYLGRRDTFNIQGFGEGARSFFGKDLSQIDLSEAALLAGMVQRPSYFNPVRYPERARERRDVVLALMRENQSISAGEYEHAIHEPVRIAKPSASDVSAPYFMALVQDELQEVVPETGRPNRYVATTLDPDLQQAAEEAVRAGMENVDRQLRSRKNGGVVPQVALIALDPRTGQVRALVGGRNYAASQLNHAVSQRQPGSVFKPFVYTAALDSAVQGGRLLTEATILNDDQQTFYYDRQAYNPGNFHGNFMGQVMMRTALAHSLNNATVSLGSQVGFKNVVAMATRAGLNDRIRATPSVALGAYETTPLEIAGAYTMFANQGVRVTPTMLAEVRGPDGVLLYRHTPDRHVALDPRVNYLMVDLLQEVMRSGTAAGVRGRGFTLPAAGKTGTSRDGWFAGFTSELVCIVWVGFDDNRDLNLEGSKSALPIWTDFMKAAAKFRPYRDAKQFPQPGGIVSAEICSESGLRAGPDCQNHHVERFLAGTAPTDECDGSHPEPEVQTASIP